MEEPDKHRAEPTDIDSEPLDPEPLDPEPLHREPLDREPLDRVTLRLLRRAPEGDGGTPVVTQVGRALRQARRRLGLSQRELAKKLGVSKSRLGRLESDAGPQSLEMVSQVLMATGFRLEVVDASGFEPQHGDASRAALLDLCDVSGRRFPAHLDARKMGYPPTYWFVRNGGWTTKKPFPEWTFERRFVPRARPARPRDWDHRFGGGESYGMGESSISPDRESSS